MTEDVELFIKNLLSKCDITTSDIYVLKRDAVQFICRLKDQCRISNMKTQDNSNLTFTKTGNLD